MKKLFIFILIVSTLPGCLFMSDKYYDAEKAMWEAKRDVSIAWASRASQPLATFTAVSGETFTVANPIIQAPMPVVGEPSAIVQGLNTVLNSSVAKIVGGGWAAGYVMGKVQGNYTAESGGSINVTRDSGNTANISSNNTETGEGIVNENHTGSDYNASDNSNNSDNSDSSDNSDNSDNRTDYSNQTADPTIVEQPPYNDPVIVDPAPYNDPVIVQPTIVNPPDPVIVDPTIVNPVIVPQPPYNDPIIVQPTVIEQPPYNDPIIVQPVIVQQGGTL